MVTSKNDGWQIEWLEAVAGWAMRELGCAGEYRVHFPAVTRRYHFHGKAQPRTRRVRVWCHAQTTPGVCRDAGRDPRLPELWDWVNQQGDARPRDAEELLVWLLGHELWHCEDPFSCRERFTRRRSPVKFVLMEQRCDEAGYRLVKAYRLARAAVMERADRIASRQAATVSPGASMAEMRAALEAARRAR